MVIFGSFHIKAFSDLIHAAYKGILFPAVWTEMLAVISKVTGADSAVVVFKDAATRKPGEHALLNAEAGMYEDYRDHFYKNDEITRTALARGMRVWRPTDIVDKYAWQNSEIHSDFLASHGMSSTVSLMIGSGRENLAQIYLVRDVHRDDFGDQAVEFLNLLQPHFTHAFHAARTNDSNPNQACDISICRYGLSRREAEACRMLVKGLSNRAIAEKLFISEFTVKDHVKSIMGKLQVSHRSEVAARILGF